MKNALSGVETDIMNNTTQAPSDTTTMRPQVINHPQITRAISPTIRKSKEKTATKILHDKSSLQNLLKTKFGIEGKDVTLPEYMQMQDEDMEKMPDSFKKQKDEP